MPNYADNVLEIRGPKKEIQKEIAETMVDPPDQRQALAARGKSIGARRLELWLQELLHARARMRLLPSHARLVLEVTLLDLCREESVLGLDELASRLEALEARLAGDSPPPSAPPEPQAPAELRPPPKPQDAPPRSAARPTSVAETWTRFLDELEEASPSLRALITRRGRLGAFRGGRATVKLVDLSAEERLLVGEVRNVKTCSRAFSRAAGQEVELAFEDSARSAPGSADPFTKSVADLFEGRIEE